MHYCHHFVYSQMLNTRGILVVGGGNFLKANKCGILLTWGGVPDRKPNIH